MPTRDIVSNNKALNGGQGQNQTADTRIFSPLLYLAAASTLDLTNRSRFQKRSYIGGRDFLEARYQTGAGRQADRSRDLPGDPGNPALAFHAAHVCQYPGPALMYVIRRIIGV